ncbi:TolC family protein [Pseudomonas fluorescens]|uniref:TolC family protein n=1 Tax=Pseudomonas fluorescens TaxID=294 RepID=UPI00209AFEF6|nr:TolC family protein [Pseudomonas fluorescens]MCO7624902.1 TolC family protein [Pseudomonas fluorescens]
MEKLLLLAILLGISGTAQPQSFEIPSLPAQVLPSAIATKLLDADPRVESARANLDAAIQEAGIIKRSPYEWIVHGTSQQRRVQGGPNYNEWTAGVERTIRLPGKSSADSDISTATLEIAEANYGEARHEAARELMLAWLNWQAAEESRQIAARGIESARESLSAVQKRSRAGDASALDVNIAKAELSDQLRAENDAKIRATTTWIALSTKFPGVERAKVVLPSPIKVTGNDESWTARIIEQSDELKRIMATAKRAEGLSGRARADKIPDPTFGVFTNSEQGNRERIYGISISMPIPSRSRSARYAQALAQEDASRHDATLVKRQLATVIAQNLAMAEGAYESYLLAKDGAQEMDINKKQVQRAYELGEADLQSLLLARRQAVAANTTALEAQVETLKTNLSLLIDAHWIWGLDHS